MCDGCGVQYIAGNRSCFCKSCGIDKQDLVNAIGRNAKRPVKDYIYRKAMQSKWSLVQAELWEKVAVQKVNKKKDELNVIFKEKNRCLLVRPTSADAAVLASKLTRGQTSESWQIFLPTSQAFTQPHHGPWVTSTPPLQHLLAGPRRFKSLTRTKSS